MKSTASVGELPDLPGFASNLSWAAVPNSAGEVEVCKGVQDFEDPPAAPRFLPWGNGWKPTITYYKKTFFLGKDIQTSNSLGISGTSTMKDLWKPSMKRKRKSRWTIICFPARCGNFWIQAIQFQRALNWAGYFIHVLWMMTLSHQHAWLIAHDSFWRADSVSWLVKSKHATCRSLFLMHDSCLHSLGLYQWFFHPRIQTLTTYMI